ncbi:hypothetical protein GIB67_023353 [Kingdonia uniflora]|uniref:Hydroxyproline-rich glycoprotein family protein n=1 Tax=Kingdonia uniflora TaxID=39325 RepID=A0A7J7LIG3_9MAGN|nr:hypothetical protein GIB67_023353 [Kingdonia uniflora]
MTKIPKESTPPPVIGKAGRYTVFLTPPTTPKPSPNLKSDTHSPPPKMFQSPELKVAPPVQPPPQQFVKSKSVEDNKSSYKFGFFWNAVSKVQNAHSNLDEYLANLFGLNHSKYQWALNDYYENKGMGFQEKGDAKPKDLAGKEQIV